MAEEKTSKRAEPRAGRPNIPGYGIRADNEGLLPWSWAVERLVKAHNYLFATTRPSGAPHVMPVWGIWLNNRFYFSTGGKTRKARNLAANPRCVICPENAAEAVIVEGVAEPLAPGAELREYLDVYNKKYNWNVDESQGPFYSVRPLVAFGFIETSDNFGDTATRWTFDSD